MMLMMIAVFRDDWYRWPVSIYDRRVTKVSHHPPPPPLYHQNHLCHRLYLADFELNMIETDSYFYQYFSSSSFSSFRW